MTQGIKIINLIFDDGEELQIEEDLFSNFYIANIDNNADEVPYENILGTNVLYANFLTLKINNLINQYYNDNVIEKINNKRNISEVIIYTENGKTIPFNIASTIDPFKRKEKNIFDKSFIEDNDYCLLICPYDIKYKKNLFA